MIQDIEEGIKIPIVLQFRSKISLSDQVRKGIFDLIQQGTLTEDTPLPTVRQLAAQLGVNFNTVARAYRVLDREGWLITRQGRGTVVTRPVRNQQIDIREERMQRLIEEVQSAAEELGISSTDLLRQIEQRIIPAVAAVPTKRKQRKRPIARFRPFLAAFPKSRKTRKETLDWRLRERRPGISTWGESRSL